MDWSSSPEILRSALTIKLEYDSGPFKVESLRSVDLPAE